jgi:hypothetical protein
MLEHDVVFDIEHLLACLAECSHLDLPLTELPEASSSSSELYPIDPEARPTLHTHFPSHAGCQAWRLRLLSASKENGYILLCVDAILANAKVP